MGWLNKQNQRVKPDYPKMIWSGDRLFCYLAGLCRFYIKNVLTMNAFVYATRPSLWPSCKASLVLSFTCMLLRRPDSDAVDTRNHKLLAFRL